MKIAQINGGEYINQVREFLTSQGYAADHPDYPIKLGNANPGQVWVRAEHNRTYFGMMHFAGLWTSLTRNTPHGWTVKRATWVNQNHADVYLLTLPEVQPKRTFSL